MIDLLNYEPHHEKACFFAYAKTGTGQLGGNHAANLCLCFRYTDSSIPLQPKSDVMKHDPCFEPMKDYKVIISIY